MLAPMARNTSACDAEMPNVTALLRSTTWCPARRLALLGALTFTANACLAHIHEPWFDADTLRQAVNLPRAETADIVIVDRHDVVLGAVEQDVRRTETLNHLAFWVRTAAGAELVRKQLTANQDPHMHYLARILWPGGAVRTVDATETPASRGVLTGRSGTLVGIPEAEVGCIVEVIGDPGDGPWSDAHRATLVAPMPTRHYRADIWMPDDTALDVKVQGLPIEATRVQEEGRQHWLLEATDLAADPTEAWTLPDAELPPFWYLRVQNYWQDGALVRVGHDWPSLLLPRTRYLYQARDTLSERMDAVARVGDDRAVTDRLFVLVRDGFRTQASEEWAPAAVAHKNWADKRGTPAEKAVLLAALLQKAGIAARFAATTQLGTGMFLADFPDLTRLNHLLLYLPDAQTGGRWLDPSCELCQPGEIPPWLDGAMAVTFAPNPTATDLAATELLPITGHVVTATLAHWHTELTLLPHHEGAKGVRTIEGTGVAGMMALRAFPGISDAAPMHASKTVKRAKGSVHIDVETECDAHAVRCSMRSDLTLPPPEGKTKNAGKFKLTAVGDGFETLFAANTPRRRPVLIDRPYHELQELVLHLPANVRMAEPPPDVDVREGPFHAACKATQTGDAWTWTRELVLPHGEVPAAQYPGLRRVIRAYAACRDAMAKLGAVPCRTLGPRASVCGRTSNRGAAPHAASAARSRPRLAAATPPSGAV